MSIKERERIKKELLEILEAELVEIIEKEGYQEMADGYNQAIDAVKIYFSVGDEIWYGGTNAIEDYFFV